MTEHAVHKPRLREDCRWRDILAPWRNPSLESRQQLQVERAQSRARSMCRAAGSTVVPDCQIGSSPPCRSHGAELPSCRFAAPQCDSDSDVRDSLHGADERPDRCRFPLSAQPTPDLVEGVLTAHPGWLKRDVRRARSMMARVTSWSTDAISDGVFALS